MLFKERGSKVEVECFVGGSKRRSERTDEEGRAASRRERQKIRNGG